MNLAPTIPYSGHVVGLADGSRGVFQTLRQMRALVRSGRVDPMVRQAATSVVFLMPEKDQAAEARAIFEYVRDTIRYLQDVHDVETLSTAQMTLAGQVGDCDDQVILLCSMLETIGYPTRFVVAGYSDPSLYDHVYCQVFAAGQWIDCDPTEHRAFGWAPPDPLIISIEKV